MAIVASNWGRQVQLTGLTPASTLSGYVALITEDNVPAEFWTLVQNGGGDIRVCENSDGTNQLPIEVVICDTIGEIVRVFVRFPTYSTALRSCWLFYDKTGETQPALSDTYGQYNVWQDKYLVVHGLVDNNDSTSNNWNPTVTGTILFDVDKGMQFSTPNYVSFPSVPDLGVTDVSVGAIVETSFYDADIIGGSIRGTTVFTTRVATADISPTLVVGETGAANLNTGFVADSDGLAAGTDTSIPVTEDVPVAVDGTVARSGAGGKFDGTWTIVQDGTVASSNNVSLGGSSLGVRGFDGTITLGRHTAWGNTSTTQIKYVQLSKEALPNDYLTLKQSNYSTPSSFWTTGTPQDTPSGGTTEIITFNEQQNLTVANSGNIDKISAFTATEELRTDVLGTFNSGKEFNESTGLALTQAETYQSIRSFAEVLNIAVNTTEVLNKIASFTDTQATGIAITGVFSKTENGLTEFNGAIPLTVGVLGSFQKIAELQGPNTLSLDATDTLVTIKVLQEIQTIQSSLNDTQQKMVLLNTPLEMALDVNSVQEKYATFSEQTSLTITTYGIVYNAINDAEKVEAIVATVQGELVVIQVTGLLFESVIEGTITENKINGIILNN